MSAPDKSADLADARERAWHSFGALAHYAKLTQGHLEIADDAGALWTSQHVREYLVSALRDFEPCRAAMRQRTDKAGDGGDA